MKEPVYHRDIERRAIMKSFQEAPVSPMDLNVSVEINHDQRTLLLEGLRFIRSARKLEFRDPMAPTSDRREAELKQIAALMERLNSLPLNAAENAERS